MSGLEPDTPIPVELALDKAARLLEVAYEDGQRYRLSFEFLRVYSPSAEVRGHGPGQAVLQTGKRDVDILTLEPVGSYAIRPEFSDGHITGLYSWDYLWTLCRDHESLWRDYLLRLEAAGASRDQALAPPPRGCGHHG